MFVNDPNIWRERAEETRVLAESFTDATAKRSMFNVAAAYERIAQNAEKRPLQRSQISRSMEVARAILNGGERLRRLAASDGASALKREMRRIAADLAQYAALENPPSARDRIAKKSSEPPVISGQNSDLHRYAAGAPLAVPPIALYRRRRKKAD